VHRVAVLRGGGIGDLMFVLPAVEALVAAYPGVEVTLLGMPSHAALLARDPAPFAAVEVLPPHPGVREGGQPDPAVTEAFCARMRKRRFDLAVQVHGGGRNSNPFLLRLGARFTIGTRTPDAPPLDRSIGYAYYQQEAQRALEVVGLVGAPPVQLEARLRGRGRVAPRRADGPRLLVIHPGATDPRRRWPAEKFGAVAAACVADGADVVVVGDETDLEAAAVILTAASGAGPGTVRSRVNELPLPELTDLLETADVVLANDSGPRHVAVALGTSTVGVFWAPNLINAGPVGRRRHRVHLSFTMDCPVCGRDCRPGHGVRCAHDDSFVAEVPVDDVLADVRDLLRTPRRVG
jgi:ADP-heptose:LPS heptosyltransferase